MLILGEDLSCVRHFSEGFSTILCLLLTYKAVFVLLLIRGQWTTNRSVCDQKLMFTCLRCDLTLTPHSRISLFSHVLFGFDSYRSPWGAPGYPGDPGDPSSGNPADIYEPARSYRVELKAASVHLIKLLFRIVFDIPAFHNHH